ncbi:GSCFA domain-containing protein [Dyadobacter frigoris]|uniref:GSCFA domain-containing protein n=1 Tax=Dyadobacter frigoris TaxID=2576211 RepID=A0A4U6D5Y1_9BACT|nr:GSCFA domain-containing protein [Dyadobacter frigoris]TKT91617.1 GSCFA domain-containing protein [Dyadobacter frigoris]GLU51822.1 hypothetical protein Dfri01_12830 [Dyadobacter frigoris]
MKQLKLTTELNVTPSEWKINHQSNIVTIGSCFADVLGSQLLDNKFPVLNNPFGTVFNPLAIAKLLDLSLDGKPPHAALYHQNTDGIWLHHDFHSSLWSASRVDLEEKLIEKQKQVNQFLRNADVLVITFGTAFAYRHRATNVLVGNCHKVPSDKFVKELLHLDQVIIGLEHLLFKLQSIKRDLRIILTVSPVRHTKDTLPLNQVSKSTLRLVCHRLSEKFKQVDYFPAYEIMVDELRDYRFYKPDLIHPNSVAEEHIFRTFGEAFIDKPALDFMKDWEGIQKMLNHHAQHGFTPSHLALLHTLHGRLSDLADQVDLSDELIEINRRIREFPVNS